MRELDELAEALGMARSCAVITGAGISVPSGIQPYRGVGGVYDDPAEGERVMEALSGHTLSTDPARTRAQLYVMAESAWDAKPNAAHEALVALEERMEEFLLVTQNVDGLHGLAGSTEAIEIHGNLRRHRCPACDLKMPVAGLAEIKAPPPCPSCRTDMRADVVLFDEMLPEEELGRLHALYRSPPEVILAIGTTALFPYIAQPVILAAELGFVTAEINPEDTLLSEHVRHRITAPADVALPELLRRLEN